jgi:hypothetical protein
LTKNQYLHILESDRFKPIKKGFTAFDEEKALKNTEHLQDSKTLVNCQALSFCGQKSFSHRTREAQSKSKGY